MEFVTDTLSGMKKLYQTSNPATLSGAIDIVVVKQPDGTLKSTPFHVRFGKLSVWSPAQKTVKIKINDVPVPIEMKLGKSGEASFVQSTVVGNMDDADTEQQDNNNESNMTGTEDNNNESNMTGTEERDAEQQQPNDLLFEDQFENNLDPLPAPDTKEYEFESSDQYETDHQDQYDTDNLYTPKQSPPTQAPGGMQLSGVDGDDKRGSSHESDTSTSAARAAATFLVDQPKGHQRSNSADAFLETPKLFEAGRAHSTGHLDVEATNTSTTMTYSNEHSAVDANTATIYPSMTLSLCGFDKLSEFEEKRISLQEFTQQPEILSDPNLVVLIAGRVVSWNVAAPLLVSMVAYRQPFPEEGIDALKAKYMASEEQQSASWWPFNRRRPSMATSIDSQDPLHDKGDDAELDDKENNNSPTENAKLLTLTSEQLKSLNLQPGENEATFTVTTKLQGRSSVTCAIFLWNHDESVVVSDIDGTITRSDLMGHAAAFLGRDWTHEGVAALYTSIEKNGYRMLYLTSRSISHAPLTRDFLKSVRQDGFKLPPGPTMFSPQNFLASINREVFARNPHEFKIACLSSVLELFPDNSPFKAGFGNRRTDIVSYNAVGVPKDRIFTVDPHGHLKLGTDQEAEEFFGSISAPVSPPATPKEKPQKPPEVVMATSPAGLGRNTVTSYPKLHEWVDLFFPPIVAQSAVTPARKSSLLVDRSYSTSRYWNSQDYLSNFDIDAELEKLKA